MNENLITVCDNCLRASCWHGIFMCDDAKSAGTTEKTEKELLALGLEHSCYWDQTRYGPRAKA